MLSYAVMQHISARINFIVFLAGTVTGAVYFNVLQLSAMSCIHENCQNQEHYIQQGLKITIVVRAYTNKRI